MLVRLFFLLSFACMPLTACHNTIEGMGDDIERAGDEIEEATD